VSVRERSYKARGFVLRGRNLGEADRIYTLFTAERGKLDAIAKGVRRAKSQLAGRLEFLAEASLTLHRGRNLDVIASAEIESTHWRALVEPATFATAHVAAEILDAFCEQDLAMPDVYALLQGLVGALGTSADPSALLPRFELRLLDALGIGPSAEACIRCGRALEGLAAWADLEAGGLACEGCRPHRSDLYALAPEDVANFRAVGAPRGGPVRPRATAHPAVARAIEAFVAYHLGKHPKAGKMLAELTQAPPSASG
jgi:DNA repair protein RecO (recombination protein O)